MGFVLVNVLKIPFKRQSSSDFNELAFFYDAILLRFVSIRGFIDNAIFMEVKNIAFLKHFFLLLT